MPKSPVQKAIHKRINDWHAKRMENPDTKARHEFMKKQWLDKPLTK